MLGLLDGLVDALGRGPAAGLILLLALLAALYPVWTWHVRATWARVPARVTAIASRRTLASNTWAVGVAFEPAPPPSGTPPSGTPPSGTPPSGTPPSGTPTSGTPPSGTPPSGALPSTPPPSGTPPSGALSSGALSSGPPSSGTPPRPGTRSSGTLPPGTPRDPVEAVVQVNLVRQPLSLGDTLQVMHHPQYPGRVALTRWQGASTPLMIAPLIALAAFAVLGRDAG
ncbi:MAG: hypothetical protein AAF677_13660 [Pseudomonadota bacterium]